MDYEKNVEELDVILKKLEDENLSIDESIKLFDRAQILYKECDEYLEKAKGSVYKVKKEIDKYKEEKMNK